MLGTGFHMRMLTDLQWDLLFLYLPNVKVNTTTKFINSWPSLKSAIFIMVCKRVSIGNLWNFSLVRLLSYCVILNFLELRFSVENCQILVMKEHNGAKRLELFLFPMFFPMPQSQYRGLGNLPVSSWILYTYCDRNVV